MTNASPDHLSAREAERLLLSRLPASVERHPVVADANALFQDAVRAASGRFCVLPDLAELGVIRLYVPAHVPAKAELHLPRIAAESGVSPRLAMDTWHGRYLPLLHVVDLPERAAEDDPRVQTVDDPEDHPFARLAVLLGPSLLLTRDHHLLDAGIGTEEYADALVVVAELIRLDAMFQSGAQAAALVTTLLAMAVRGAVRAISSSPVAAGACAALAFMLATDWRDEMARRLGSARKAAGDGFDRAFDAAAPLVDAHASARATLAAQIVHPQAPRCVDAVAMRAVAVRFASSPAEFIVRAMRNGGFEGTDESLSAWLEAHPSLRAAADGGLTLGRRLEL